MFDDDDEGRPAAPTRGADARRSRRPDVPLPPRPGTARRGGQDGRSGRCERGSPDDRGARGFGGERVGPCDGAGDADTRADGADATGARALLEGLAGVHADEERRGSEPRTRPRLSVEPVHALVVMAILVVMLAASLALLVQQSVNLAAASPEPTSIATSPHASGDTAPSCTPSASGALDAQSQSSRTGAAQGQQDAAQTSPQQQPTTDPAPQTAQQALPGTSSQPIDLNTATQEQLETVKGIGPVTAANIIAYRAGVGRFGAVDELLNIDGIGPKTLEKIRGQVTVR